MSSDRGKSGLAPNAMRQGRKILFLFGTVCLSVTLPISAYALNVDPERSYSPSLRNEHPDRLLWGDLHLHSNLSMDAYSLDNEALRPEETYRFAKGETIVSTVADPAKLSRPLNVLSVTDHAEYVGVLVRLTEEKTSAWNIKAKNSSIWYETEG